MSYVAPLIDEAWDHHRRRRRTYLKAGSVLALAAGLIFVMGRFPREVSPRTPGLSIPVGTIRISPSVAFSEAPYMGVRCPGPNSIACDRIGLAVWLKHPAYSVVASIAGARVSLDWFGDQRLLGRLKGPRRTFDGYLQPAGIVSRLHVRAAAGDAWYGEGAPSPMVWVLINYGHEHHAITQLRVPLGAEWG